VLVIPSSELCLTKSAARSEYVAERTEWQKDKTEQPQDNWMQCMGAATPENDICLDAAWGPP
jgi:hypothetical protein